MLRRGEGIEGDAAGPDEELEDYRLGQLPEPVQDAARSAELLAEPPGQHLQEGGQQQAAKVPVEDRVPEVVLEVHVPVDHRDEPVHLFLRAEQGRAELCGCV